MTPDALDQYFRNAESTAREALKIVVKAIQGLYKSRYLGNQQEKTYYNKSRLTNVGAGQNVCVNRMYALSVEELSCGLARTLPEQRS
jgi:hypothetical protein